MVELEYMNYIMGDPLDTKGFIFSRRSLFSTQSVTYKKKMSVNEMIAKLCFISTL